TPIQSATSPAFAKAVERPIIRIGNLASSRRRASVFIL
uniref:Uncharacterized protein n=1 Tax=Meloidogyne floridensis TaxID=298350 RepID=A0A915P9S9_9BILA